MIVRNRVKDFEKWKAVFDEESDSSEAYGLKLENLWRSIDDPNEVFFILSVESVEKAHEFVSLPESAETGVRSGVIDGEFWIVE